MSKRNFVLLIIILTIVAVVTLGFLYFNQPKTNPPGGNNGGTNFISDFNPFGKSKPTPPQKTPPANVSGPGLTPGAETPKMKLVKVSSVPIAGFGVFQKERFKDVPQVTPATPPPVGTVVETPKIKITTKPTPPPTEFVPALRYVDRVTGNIFQTFADKIEERKFSGTVIPKIYEAYFGNSGESVIMRYLKPDDRTIETFVGTLPKEVLGADTTGSNEVKGSFLPENVSDVSISPDFLKAFYLFNSGQSAIGTTYELKTGKKTQVFDSPFTEWLSFWPNGKMITLTTKPEANVLGYMYAIDPSKKDLTKILGEVNGLTTLTSPDGKLVLFGNNTLSLSIYHKDTRGSDLLGVKTLPEKCVWGKVGDVIYCAVPKLTSGGGYPDSWYKGEESFSDQIWQISVLNGTATMILDPATISGGGEIDGIKLALDQGENYLFFVNKKDSFLWELILK